MHTATLKGADFPMTNEQYYGVINMIYVICRKCKDRDEILKEVGALLKDHPDVSDKPDRQEEGQRL